MDYVKSFGINNKTTRWERIIFININKLMMILLPAALLAIVILFSLNESKYLLLPILTLCWSTFTLVLNRNNKVDVSKHFVFIGSILIIATAAVSFSFNIGFQVLLIVLSLVPFVLFNRTKVQYIYFGFTYTAYITLLFYFLYNTTNTSLFLSIFANSTLAFAIQFLNIFLFQNKISDYKEIVNKQNKELSFFNQKLKQKVTERTNALNENNIELERLYKDASAYAYIVSHDLKEPLRTISGFTQLIDKRLKGIENDELQSELLEYSEFVTTGTKRMNNLIESVLKYYSLNKEDELVIENVNLKSIFQKLQQSIDDIVSKNEAKFEFENIPENIWVNGTQLETLFQNLFVNAIKFRSNESPIIKVTCIEHSENFYFIVKDNGLGIDADHSQIVFEPFKTATSDFTKKGSGIGLSICNRVIEMHKGEIWLETPKDGKGAEFHFTISKNLK